MPKHPSLRRVMVIGSGPIVIGQAAEFDYSGTQACRALKEEGLTVILQNCNPATIMTDRGIADRVYLEPLTVEYAARIIDRERPDGLLPTLGGQVGLNLARELQENGVLDRYGVRLLGTPIEAIVRAEDREQFKDTMEAIGEPVPQSTIARSVDEGLAFASDIGYPVIVRPAYTLGGSGGGLAPDPAELAVLLARGLKQSPIGQVLLERSVAGFKEIEYEVMRDGRGTFVTVCDMENIDPMGVHTGDSVVVAPCQTLTDGQRQLLRSSAVRIIEALGIEGGCNIQFALDPAGGEYYVIEVNPRVSRSSALASKATGYPIAKVAAKIAVGLTLDEIENPVTATPFGDSEPAVDYTVVKIPRWPFDKFPFADRFLGTQMKATGEVMAIGTSFTAALLKALRSLDLGCEGLEMPGLEALGVQELLDTAARADDRRLFSLAECLRRGVSMELLAHRTMISPFFLEQIALIVKETEKLRALRDGAGELGPEDLQRLKGRGLSDGTVGKALGLSEREVTVMRKRWGIQPAYSMVDGCAGELEAVSSYYYSTYGGEDEVRVTTTDRVAVIGSGPIRIGQGVEFDYCSVHALEALRDAGLTSVMINNNPETVSTDFDVSDRLYFEPLVAEDVLNVLEREDVAGVITQFGGQTAINLTDDIHEAGFEVLGTSPDAVDMAEDRDRFYSFLDRIGVSQPPGRTVTTVEEALEAASELDYPLVLRPSYVLGGRAMEIVASGDELRAYLDTAVSVSPDRPVLVDKYLQGPEFEVDAVSDGETVVVPGVMEHIEWAGVHSGDSIAVYPTRGATPEQVQEMVETTVSICREMPVVGLVNVQFVLHGGRLHVLEVNPRSSRTVPFLTKMTGVPMVRLATAALLGEKLAGCGYETGLHPWQGAHGVKVPVFSWAKMDGVDTFLGPEMKSTGEVMGMASSFDAALHKGLLAAGFQLPRRGTLLVTVADRDKEAAVSVARAFARRGWRVLATAGTAAFLSRQGESVGRVRKLSETDVNYPGIAEIIGDGSVDLIINTITRGRRPRREGFRIRRMAADMGVVCLTNLDTARAVAEVLDPSGDSAGEVVALQDYE